MTFIYLIFTFEIIIPQLFLFNLQVKYLSNYAEHLKKLVPYYVLPPFTILKLLYPTSQLAYLEDDFNSRTKSSHIKTPCLWGPYQPFI